VDDWTSNADASAREHDGFMIEMLDHHGAARPALT
jgi:hypothetical protein